MRTEPPPHPLRAAFIAQAFGALIAFGLLALVSPRTLNQPMILAIAQGLCAAFTGYKLEAPPWWLAIHLGFMPLVVVASKLNLAPGWYLGAFLLLLAVYWRVAQSRVPLYLSNRQTAAAVAELLPKTGGNVIDLGCGNGAFLRHLASLRPDCRFVGVEYAPLTWLWARITCAGIDNCRIIRGDFWQHPLAEFDLVYAFLSPVPMPRLWAKALQEMHPGAKLVSNTFPVPDQTAERLIAVADRRSTRLYCYCPKPRPPKPMQ